MLESIEIKKGSKELITDNLEKLISIDTICFFNLAWNKDAFLSELPSKFESSLLLFNHEHLEGYAIVSKKENTFHLHKFVVNPIFNSQGFGQILMDNLLDQINYKTLTLKVEVSNINAIVFYLKKKFIFTEKLEDYYQMIYNGK
jgi:ribosomal protein S18 acetylase RimI-like enzyme